MAKELFSRKQKYEMITAIEGRGEVPVKFIYFGKGAKNWQNYRNKNMDPKVKGLEYQQHTLLNKKLPSIYASLEDTKNLNFIDLGPGDGGPAIQILDFLAKNTREESFRYVPIDISDDILKLAKEEIRKKSKVAILPYLIDFESGNFSDVTFKLRNGKRTNFMVLLGNTLGNAANMQRVLTNVRESMTRKDYLLLGVELVNEHLINKILRQYKEDELLDIVLWPLEYYGVKKSDGELRLRFNHKLSRIEGYFVPKKDTPITIGYEKITLAKGAGILVLASTKFSGALLTDLLQDAGFRIDYYTTTHDNNFALVLCQASKSRNLD